MSSIPVKDTGIKDAIDIIKIVRILAAAALLILANTLNITAFTFVVLSVAAALIAGFDLVLNAAAAIGEKDYFNYNIILIFVAVVGFAAGCANEACLLIIMYQLGSLLLGYAMYRSRKEIFSFIPDDGSDTAEAFREIVSKPTALKSSVLTKTAPIMDMLLKAALLVALIYAVLMPLITEMTYVMSIRRGLMLILAAAPASALISFPLSAETGLALAASHGVLVKNSEVLENLSHVTAAAFDKDEVFADACPKLASISSPILDNGTFKALAAYVAYNSQLRIAVPILAAYKGTVMPQYIEKSNDIPGCGMEVTIHGVPLCIMTKDVFDARNIAIPEKDVRGGFTFYMAVANKYAGRICFKENVNPYAQAVVSDLKEFGGIRTVLLSDDSEGATADFAETVGADEFHYGCTSEKKAEILEEIKTSLDDGEKLMYVSAENGEFHSSADIDARVGDDDGADMRMSSVGVFGLPVAYTASKRVCEIQKANLIAIVLLKLVLVILALLGYATLWFIAFIDMVLACAAVLNSIQVTNDSLISQLKNRMGSRK